MLACGAGVRGVLQETPGEVRDPVGVGVGVVQEESGAGVLQGPSAEFLVGEADFDAIYGKISARGMEHWADPRGARPGQINHNDGGRGVYFRDPAGHYLEILTRPYGSGG